ncbi:protein FAM168A isoform 2, partial [Daubentonia madagascariensis]
MNPVYSPVQPGAPYGNPKNMAYTGYPTAYPAAAPAYNPSLYPTNSPSYAPATLLMKQAWPQNSSSCGTEGTFHLPVDTGTENRTYQASSAAFRYTAGTPYKVPPTQSNTAPPPYSPVTQPLSDGHVSNQKCLPPAESVCPGSLLHTASVCCPAPCHPPHHGRPAQQHSLCHLPGSCCCSQDQWRGHGYGGRHHHGNVSRYPADYTPAHCNWGTPCLHANIQGPRNPCVQLRAPALV